MRPGSHRWTLGAALLALTAAAAARCATVPEPVPTGRGLEQLGERLFTEETFDGNGRVCSTCHEPERFGTITPAFVQAQFAAAPGGPLFRAIDSDDGAGVSYERLKTHATVRVPIDLPTQTASGLGVRLCDDPARTRVFLNRGNPTMFNTALDGHLMHDGREGDNLDLQALNAVRTHAEPEREPTAVELAAIAAFQKSLFSHDAMRDLLRKGESIELPEARTPSEKRGRAFFEPDRQCGQCHSGPLLNRTSAFHPDAVGFAFESAFVGREPDNPNPKFRWCYVNLETNEIVAGPDGVPEVFPEPVADPGRGLLAGVVEVRTPEGRIEFIPNEILASLAGPVFKIPTLWGSPDTAPYFHDNSAKDLDAVLEQYNFVFDLFPDGSFGLSCDKSRPKCLDAQDKTDIINFMQLLAFERRPPSDAR